MNRDRRPSRRALLQGVAAGLAVASTAEIFAAEPSPRPRNRIKQSVCRWCYSKIPLERLAAEAAKIGYQSVELLRAAEVKTVKQAGLTCAVLATAGTIAEGLNRTENHERIEKELRENIDFAAAENIPSVLVMSGNRTDRAGRTISDAEGLANCAAGLKRVVGYAEQKQVTILMEGLNSKVNHRDYMYDKTAWGVELCRRVGSPRFKLLYDIYHMQIMEGDIIATIRANKDHIGHYHTGGVPGRNEIDDSQELNYPAIIRAIVETGYQGYLGQEFIPRRDPMDSLAQAFRICDV